MYQYTCTYVRACMLILFNGISVVYLTLLSRQSRKLGKLQLQIPHVTSNHRDN